MTRAESADRFSDLDDEAVTRQCWQERKNALGRNAAVANVFGVTPLWLACTNGNAAMVELLLSAGADVNGAIGEGETALMVYTILLRYWEWTPEDDVRPLIFIMSD